MNAAYHDLLFGLLALQNGLIDQGQLVAAFQAWTRDKARPLADHLVARGDLDAEQRPASRPWSRLHLKKHGGDVEKSLAAIPVGRSTRESLAQIGDPEIEATLGHIGSAHGSTEDGDAATARPLRRRLGHQRRPAVPHPSAPRPGRPGRRLRRPRRRAAPRGRAQADPRHHADDPVSRQRFLIEAEITGGLEHPGIVPVYGLGTYGDGRPYYAMRFIKGDSLKEAIEHFHADDELEERPRPSLARSCASFCGGSPTSATRSTTPTRAACCTGTSSRAI